jgi:hypothetical protein
MSWTELDLLTHQLSHGLDQGAFRALGPVQLDPLPAMDAELLVRITLADIDHVREWHRIHPYEPGWESRRESLVWDTKRLLAVAGIGGPD